MHKKRLGELHLQLPDIEKCTYNDCLRCEFSGIRKKWWKDRAKWKEQGFRPCKSIRAIYERRKKDFVSTRTDQARDRAAQKDAKIQKVSDKTMADAFYEHYIEDPERVRFNRNGDIETAYIRVMLEEKFDQAIGGSRAYRLRTKMYMDHPELDPSKRKKKGE